MVYIDPKDQPSATDDQLFDDTWNERKALRLDHLRLTKRIEALDTFIAEYQRRKAPKQPIGICSCVKGAPFGSDSTSGRATNNTINPLCPLHGLFAQSSHPLCL